MLCAISEDVLFVALDIKLSERYVFGNAFFILARFVRSDPCNYAKRWDDWYNRACFTLF